MASNVANWTYSAINTLIEIYGDSKIQALFEGQTRNKDVYETIHEKMLFEGYTYTWKQIRDKIKNLRKDYRQQVMLLRKSGAGREDITFRYYDKMDAILGDKPATTPHFILDTSDYEIDVEGDIPEDHGFSTEPTDCTEDINSNEDIDGCTTSNGNVSELGPESKKMKNDESKEGKASKYDSIVQKRKRKKKELNNDDLKAMIELFNENENKIYEKQRQEEEKRRTEERKELLEIEERIRQYEAEREDRMRKEDQKFYSHIMQFQSQMMMMLAQNSIPQSRSHNQYGVSFPTMQNMRPQYNQSSYFTPMGHASNSQSIPCRENIRQTVTPIMSNAAPSNKKTCGNVDYSQSTVSESTSVNSHSVTKTEIPIKSAVLESQSNKGPVSGDFTPGCVDYYKSSLCQSTTANSKNVPNSEIIRNPVVLESQTTTPASDNLTANYFHQSLSSVIRQSIDNDYDSEKVIYQNL